MRDHPAHYGQMLAGLWGGHNYHNLSLAAQLSRALFSWPATGEYTSDQHSDPPSYTTARQLPVPGQPPGEVRPGGPLPHQEGRGLLDRQRPRPRQDAAGDGGWDVSSGVQASAAQGRVDQLLIQWII